MKKNLFMMAALVGALAMPAVSQGAASVWFQYAGGDASIQQTGGGNVGETLALEYNNTPGGTLNLTVEMYANVTDVGIYGNITSLSADNVITVTDVTTVAPPGGTQTPAASLGTGPGPIATNFGGATFSGPGYLGSNILMATIQLSFNAPVGDINIDALIGTTLWGDAQFSAPQVSFGENPAVGGAEAGAGGTVITITEVPEPATLSLLGLGALALIRRRR